LIAISPTARERQIVLSGHQSSMSEQKVARRGRRMARDGAGSIEGLPLQLMIMGIIASLGTAVIVGWVSSIDTPVYIGSVETDPHEVLVADADGDCVYEAQLDELAIRVLDTGSEPIEGVAVLCEGASLDNDHHRLYGVTDQDGKMVFSEVAFKVSGDRLTSVRISVGGQGVAGDYWTELIILPS
jgi:hypothetical protein